jgi:hypothetical protein
MALQVFPDNNEGVGASACLVLSKILGIGTAERNWKQVKAVKSGQRVNTGIEKTKKQVLIYAQYQQTLAQVRMTKLAAAGKLWEDEDFASMKMDPFCKEIKESLQAEQMENKVRILRLWQERWELEKIGPNGNFRSVVSVVSNTRGYQSSLDVPLLPKILTTRIKLN